jgi:hypothetical protein
LSRSKLLLPFVSSEAWVTRWIDDPVRLCLVCEEPLTRKRFNGRLEDRTRFLSRRTCGQSCGNFRPEPSLDGYRSRARKLRGDSCERCSKTTDLHAHHVNGDVTDNRAENIETVCASCHIAGHWAEKRTHALRMLGNAVVPQQTRFALDLLSQGAPS